MRKPAAHLIIAAAGVAAAHGLTTLHQPQPAGTVLPRGVSETSLGEPTAVAAEGVSVVRDRNPDGKPVATIVIGWDRVREVTGPLATEASKFTSTAEKAWRARARLERGDWVAAEPLFEELFSEYRTRTGPTALTVAGGLVRCRLMRGAQTAAVEPWIAWLRAQPTAGAGVDSPPESVGQQVSKMIDPGTGLIPGLPPMWVTTAAVQALARSEVPAADQASKPSTQEVRAASLFALYVLAAKADTGGTGGLPERGGATADPGVRLVYDIVKSRLGDESQRRDARRSLQERITGGSPGWVEVWCRVAVGRSLLMEKTEEDRRLGLVSLAYVASRSAPEDAYLTGLALAEMALALSADGNEAAASLFANEAADRFPDHPALESPQMARWMVARSARPSKPATTPTAPAAPTTAEPAAAPEPPK
ncbi:MAG: hypothetical protein HEQ23_11220 [Tepidisphaera sp.]